MSTLAIKGLTRSIHYRHKSALRNRTVVTNQQHDKIASTTTSKQTSSKEINNDSFLSDKCTTTFVKRTLCHTNSSHLGSPEIILNSQPLQDLLPPLTSSNEIDLQLYAIISIILRDFIQAWYNKLTPDHEFVDEVVHVIAHCTRGLEQRVRQVDLENLLMDKIPEVIIKHVESTRIAYRNGNDVDRRRDIYHVLNPHPALSPVPSSHDDGMNREQTGNEAAWRQILVEKVLALLLNPDDYRNPCLRILVQEIVSEMILGNVICEKMSQGWFIWEIIAKSLQSARERQDDAMKKTGQDQSIPAQNNVVDSFQRNVHAIWTVMISWLVLLFTLGQNIFTALSNAISLPLRTNKNEQDKIPIIDMSIFKLPCIIFDLQTKMPWLTGLLSMIKYFLLYGPGNLAGIDARVDRLLSHHITLQLTSPSLLPNILKTARGNLFPNNIQLGPGKAPPSTEEEISTIKRACAREIRLSLPRSMTTVLFPDHHAKKINKEDVTANMEQQIETELLERLFHDAYLNKHLVINLLELVLCSIFPELVSESITPDNNE